MNIKILRPEIQESEFTTPSNRAQLSRGDYLNDDQKVTGDNPDTLELGRIKFRYFHTKSFYECRKSSK